MLSDNACYLSGLIKPLYDVLLIALLTTTFLSLFFAYKWFQASSLDNVYLLSADQTIVASRTDGSLVRSQYEIRAFVNLFLDKAFAHNE